MITEKGLACVRLLRQCTNNLQREQAFYLTGFEPLSFKPIGFAQNWYFKILTAWVLLAKQQSEYCTLHKFLVY
jgi:hypothetical protein